MSCGQIFRHAENLEHLFSEARIALSSALDEMPDPRTFAHPNTPAPEINPWQGIDDAITDLEDCQLSSGLASVLLRIANYHLSPSAFSKDKATRFSQLASDVIANLDPE